MKENHSRVQHTVEYPKHVFSPKELLHFIETRPFTEAWEDLGLNDEEDLAALQISIMLDPKGAPVISGTSGVRKMRFSPPGWNVGKRDALRACYVYFEDAGIVLLSIVYTKSEKDSLTADEKKACRRLVAMAENELSMRPVRIKKTNKK